MVNLRRRQAGKASLQRHVQDLAGGERARSTDAVTVRRFGLQWQKFDHSQRPLTELQDTFESYFSLFPWDQLPPDAVGADVGCGTGRWAQFVAPRVGHLYCLDPSSDALAVARSNLAAMDNCETIVGAAGSLPLPADELDFAYCLGVLHYTPDPEFCLRDIVRTLKPGAPLLLYVYYSMEQRPAWFRTVWTVSDKVRRVLSKLPYRLTYQVSQLIALLVYWPLARLSLLLEKIGLPVDSIPLSSYRRQTFYVMRTDSLDRFGTRIELRFSRADVRRMMETAGLERVTVNETSPHWVAVGFKAPRDGA
jgi:ubiquinone/menaquinone biosynthesis C-methylase UbiE